MAPVLNRYDIVEYQEIPFSRVAINDVVYFKKKNKHLMQRVIYRKNSHIIVQADANTSSYIKISKKEFLGVIVGIKQGEDTVPLDSIYLLQSSVYWKEIQIITKVFNENNIVFVFLKGLPLHLFYEKSIPRRIYADCDLLIAKKDVMRVRKTLIRMGYQKVRKTFLNRTEKMKKKIVEEDYAKEVNGIQVVFDVHHEPAFLMTELVNLNYMYPQELIDKYADHLLTNRRKVSIKGHSLPLLSIEDQIVYLFIHLFHHNFRGTYRYNILLELLNKRFNEKKVLAIINNFKLVNFIYPGFILLSKYYAFDANISAGDFAISDKIKKFVRKNILQTPIFIGEDRIDGGVGRFKLIFHLSPNSLKEKILVFLDRQVFYSIIWVIYRKIIKNA